MSTDNAGFALLELDKLTSLETIHSEIYGSNTESNDEICVTPEPLPINTAELNSIQKQLTKWLSNYDEQVTEDKFIQLLKKIAPFVSEKDVKELFHQFDFQDSGSVGKEVLLQNNYLAHLILKLYSDDKGGVMDDEDDQKVPNTSIITTLSSKSSSLYSPFADSNLEILCQKLRLENDKLRQWIDEVGKPAQVREKKLQNEVEIYRADNQQFRLDLERARSERDSLNTLQSTLSMVNSQRNLITQEHEALKKLHLTNKKSMQLNERKLIDAQKKIKNLEKLNKELTAINEKYRKVNDELNEAKEADAEQLQNLRSAVIESQLQIQQLLKEKQENEFLYDQQNEELNDKLQEKEVELANTADNGNLAPMGMFHGVQHTLQASAVPNLFNDIGSLNMDVYSGPGHHPTASALTSGLRLTQRLSMNRSRASAQQSLKIITPRHGNENDDVTFAKTAEYFGSPDSSNNGVVSPQILISPAGIKSGHTSAESSMVFMKSDDNPYTIIKEHGGHGSMRSVFMGDEEQMMNEFVDESIRKEIELETRQAVKQELMQRFEIEAQQIRVDAHIERSKDKDKYDDEILEMREKFEKYKENNKNTEVRYKRKILELEKQLKQMTNRHQYYIKSNSDSDDSDNDGGTDFQSEGDNYKDKHIKRHKRTPRAKININDETCTQTTCTFPKLKQFFFGKKDE